MRYGFGFVSQPCEGGYMLVGGVRAVCEPDGLCYPYDAAGQPIVTPGQCVAACPAGHLPVLRFGPHYKGGQMLFCVHEGVYRDIKAQQPGTIMRVSTLNEKMAIGAGVAALGLLAWALW